MKVLGKEVADPRLHTIGLLAFIPLFLGILTLALTPHMIDEKKVRAEESIAKLFGGLPPRRILTDLGKKVQTGGFVALGISGVLMVYLIAVTR